MEELEIETYVVDGEPRLRLDIAVRDQQATVIIEGRENLLNIRNSIMDLDRNIILNKRWCFRGELL